MQNRETRDRCQLLIERICVDEKKHFSSTLQFSTYLSQPKPNQLICRESEP